MAKANRDDFSKPTALKIAKRAGFLCSFPTCRKLTVGASEDGATEVSVGTAAHICAAAAGGPRYDPKMSVEDRRSPDNGIWLCRTHGKVIDSDVSYFTVTLLRNWKKQAEEDSWRRVMSNEPAFALTSLSEQDLRAMLRSAAESDLNVFRNSAKWPSTSVELRLELDGFETPIATRALAQAVISLDDLVLVAGPGMGKTTTMFQLAESVLASAKGVPLIVLLNEWATQSATLLKSILQRQAFKSITEDAFRRVAAGAGVVLLLDGWNELSAEERKRARVQLDSLKSEIPEIAFVLSTRKLRNQSIDAPFDGKRVNLLPLSEEQQLAIARSRRGDDGAELWERARRAGGVRELLEIPLYLTTLLSFPKAASIPETREAILRQFVEAVEAERGRTERLSSVLQDFQADYLRELASFATSSANTAISDSNARRCVTNTSIRLSGDGQITVKPEPNAAIDALVSNHILMRAGDSSGIAFQHQQFQEWYASLAVEEALLSAAAKSEEPGTVKTKILNWPAWEEAILFAIERMSRGDERQRTASSQAVEMAFDVDPMLAAEMIYRASEDVWFRVASRIQPQVGRWHTPGRVDRAFRFMLTTGRVEFRGCVWPMLTHTDQQVSLRAFRSCRSFRSSVLGPDAVREIGLLDKEPRMVFLTELASYGDIMCLDLAAEVASRDIEPEVRVSVVDALAFRRADRHIVKVLREADSSVFDTLVRKRSFDVSLDSEVRRKIEDARGRWLRDQTLVERMRAIVFNETASTGASELPAIVATMELGKSEDPERHLLFEAYRRFPREVAEGIVLRLRSGRSLFFGADDMLASTGLVTDDEEIVSVALNSPQDIDESADAAASILGAKSTGKLIDALLLLVPQVRTDVQASNTYRRLERRLEHVPAASLTAAVNERSLRLSDDQVSHLASLISRRRSDGGNGSRPFNHDTVRAILNLAVSWGRRLLASKDATRWQKAQIAWMACRVSGVELVPVLRDLLDDNLRRLRDFRAEAESMNWQPCKAVDETRVPMTHEYQQAFMAINSPEARAVMRDYLEDPDFGECAARVLAYHWAELNEPSKDTAFRSSVDWSGVSAKRSARAADPTVTCDEAEAIFSAISRLLANEPTRQKTSLAVALGVSGLRLPHGQRSDEIRRLVSAASLEGLENSRASLLLSLVLSGEEIDVTNVVDGIRKTLEAAETKHWILKDAGGFYLKVWLRLLPFVDRPSEALQILLDLPADLRAPHYLDDILYGFVSAPFEGVAEEFLFGLAGANSSFLQSSSWQHAVTSLGTSSAVRRLVDILVDGKTNLRSLDTWGIVRDVGDMLSQHSDVRRYVFGLLANGASTPGLVILARAVAEALDEEGMLVLLKCEQLRQLRLGSHEIERVVTERIPVDGYEGAFSIAPVRSDRLRKRLFALVGDGRRSDVAARWLNTIDVVRDEYGLPEDEPRHPDLNSGRPWPVLRDEVQ